MNVEAAGEKHKRIIESLEKRWGSSRLAGIYLELLQIQMEAKSSATVARPNLGENLLRERSRKGLPLLRFEDFCPDWSQVQTVFRQIIDWATADSEGSGGMHEHLRDVATHPGLLRETAGAWYRGFSLKASPLTRHVDAKVFTSVVGATIKPFLSAYAELLLPGVDQESWRRSYCPICGGNPDFTSLKEDGTRWLFCSRCDAEWLFSRIGCPYCGTRNQETLGYFTDEGQPGLYRLYVCDECHTYLKGIDSRVSGAEVFLPLERVCTLDLDRQGQEKGYQPGWTTRGCYSGSSYGSAEEEKERRVH